MIPPRIRIPRPRTTRTRPRPRPTIRTRHRRRPRNRHRQRHSSLLHIRHHIITPGSPNRQINKPRPIPRPPAPHVRIITRSRNSDLMIRPIRNRRHRLPTHHTLVERPHRKPAEIRVNRHRHATKKRHTNILTRTKVPDLLLRYPRPIQHHTRLPIPYHDPHPTRSRRKIKPRQPPSYRHPNNQISHQHPKNN